MITRPILAVKFGNVRGGIQHTAEGDILNAPYPLICTPKIDGIRAFVYDKTATSRNGKMIPNLYIASRIGRLADGLDGEIVTYTDGIMDDFNTVQSKVMSHGGKPEFKYMVFDYVQNVNEKYVERLRQLKNLIMNTEMPEWVYYVPTKTCSTPEELEAYETQCLLDGFEGICMRKPNSPYKGGRSTWNEFYLAALTRWVRKEAHVIDFEEMTGNENEAFEGAFGLTERSSSQAGMVGKNTLGAFWVECMESGEKFSVGGGKGMDADFRKEVWQNKIKHIGKIMTYKFKPFGMKKAPRHPQFVGWRSPNDM